MTNSKILIEIDGLTTTGRFISGQCIEGQVATVEGHDEVSSLSSGERKQS